MPTTNCKIALALSLAVAAVCLAAASGPDNFTTNQGTMTLLNAFTQGWGLPGPLVEVSPGAFAGLARLNGQSSRAFMLTSQGALNTLHLFPGSTQVTPGVVQAVNARLYGDQEAPDADFSLGLNGNIQLYYPNGIAYPPILSVQTVTGLLYGTQSSYNSAGNAFVQMTLSGTMTVLHNFTPQEGIPYGYPILASDGNFYGISGIGNQYGSTSSMVYRMTPKGTLTILATYPDGRPNYPPGSFFETLIQASNGKLYGTASLGGSNRAGAIFELSLDGTYKVLYQYSNWVFGIPTFLMQASDGNLYGAAVALPQSGGVASLFKITTDGKYQTYYVMNNPNIGTCNCWLTQANDGKLYGTSENGGPGGVGAVWTWDLGLPKPLPAVRGTLPSSGAVGASIIVYGHSVLGATGVSFNGVPAQAFRNIGNDYISATVPQGATTGPVTVTTPNGSATSPGSFTVE